jgi:hypothetical protein
MVMPHIEKMAKSETKSDLTLMNYKHIYAVLETLMMFRPWPTSLGAQTSSIATIRVLEVLCMKQT